MNNLELIFKMPSEYAEYIGLEYASSTSEKHKKNNGQFFTSKKIADFMGGLAEQTHKKISILDPGCGTAILACSVIEKLALKSELSEINLTLYETDSQIIERTKKVLEFLFFWLEKWKIHLKFKIIQADFIIDNADAFDSDLLFIKSNFNKFDLIISNPPYFKISKADKRARVANELVYGQPNIYSIFLGLSAKLLKPKGELIFITPRSFASGNYFKAFRESFFQNVSISNIHIFESRNKMFKNDKVLQENIILRATKKYNSNIQITVSECDAGLSEYKSNQYKTEELIDLKSREKILYIPSNLDEANTIKIFKKWKKSLNDYNIQISTGPVVAFRCTEFLKEIGPINDMISPLIWLHNIKEMEFIFPLEKKSKPSYIVNSIKSKKVLIKNKNYIFLRRFSSKDDKSRLVCCPYFSNTFSTDMVGVENHINYIYRPNGELTDNEIWGISGLLTSSLFDTFFRTFNGNTQVGASELKQIMFPPLNDIELIGNKIKEFMKPKKQDIDKIINKVLLEKLCQKY